MKRFSDKCLALCRHSSTLLRLVI